MANDAPDLEAVLDETRAILESQKHALSALTQRKIRTMVEQALQLDSGALNLSTYKDAIKELVTEFVSSDAASPSGKDPQQSTSQLEPVPAKMPKSPAKDEDTIQKKDKMKGKKRKLSAKYIEDSGEDEAEKPTAKKAKPSQKPKPTRKEKAMDQFMDLIGAEMRMERAERAAAEDDQPKPPGGSSSKVIEIASDESGLDEDESAVPAKKPKKASKKAEKEKEKKPRKSKSTAPLDKNEEEIKRLKSFIVACGVRKAWSKEFKDLDKPSQQIARLKKILQDLGMTGRLSMEKAKSIRAKRELAQELEDVVEFDRKRGSGATEAKAKATAAIGNSDDEDEEDEVVRPAKSKIQDRLKAFLADQSDDE